ncbi:Nucleolar GTP-binding protein 2 [Seminavis robusta]|uniref:Nucleolar GTP-binding protein 2 n=1 Tax=Seminavis robusta TaxID=568900 RepID=A0A9N8E1W1_9STRA|nr:Nucleolar GTP-binding protein 2 [Seminavis robusta]|eukprot:Sro447_g144970.1 Nucleolar GTP-binding protein 2 (643) ;mRNA; r:53471-55507
MAKIGWKSAKPTGRKPAVSALRTNRLPRTSASSKLGKGRRKEKDGKSSQRSAETIQRLKMYVNGKPIRNKGGRVVGGSHMMSDRAGDRKIDASTGRIQPDRRWFGNTRVVTSTQLDQFRQEMTEQAADPYSVVLKRKKLPLGLLTEATEYVKTNQSALLEQEPFQKVFGAKSQRKRVKLDQLMMGRSADQKDDTIGTAEGETKIMQGATATVATNNDNDTINNDDDDDDTEKDDDTKAYAKLVQAATQSHATYHEINAREGIVPWGRDSNLTAHDGEGVDWRHEKKDDLFLKGQSKRIWGEFFKVVDCSDVVLHVMDARNVPGTRCTMIERHINKHAKHKHLVFVLNKVDLVPNWVAKRWMGELAKDRPTVAFHSSLTNAFGKGALISLLRQFGTLHQDKKQISVGVIGYPNVGKSSVINTLISKKSCNVAPIPGETKIWQYITLFKRISLIDCPGVVVDTAGDTETDSVLKGVVRAERLEYPEDFIQAICDKVKREHIAAQYGLSHKGGDTWETANELMEMIARKSGRLLKGGDPCMRSAAITLINDFQRGRLPHYVAPPELKEEVIAQQQQAQPAAAEGVQQDLEVIGEEHMEKETPMEEDDKLNDKKVEAAKTEEESDDSEDEEETPTTALIGAGEWED